MDILLAVVLWRLFHLKFHPHVFEEINFLQDAILPSGVAASFGTSKKGLEVTEARVNLFLCHGYNIARIRGKVKRFFHVFLCHNLLSINTFGGAARVTR